MHQVGVEDLATMTQSVPSIELRLIGCAFHSTQIYYYFTTRCLQIVWAW